MSKKAKLSLANAPPVENVFFIDNGQYEQLSGIANIDVSVREATDEARSVEIFGTMQFLGRGGSPMKWNPLYCVCPFPQFTIIVNEPRWSAWFPSIANGELRREIVTTLQVVSNDDGFFVVTEGYYQRESMYDTAAQLAEGQMPFVRSRFQKLYDDSLSEFSVEEIDNQILSYLTKHFKDSELGYKGDGSGRSMPCPAVGDAVNTFSEVFAGLEQSVTFPEFDIYTGEFFLCDNNPELNVQGHTGRRDYFLPNGLPSRLTLEMAEEAARHLGAVAAFCLMVNNRDVVIRRISDPHRTNRQLKRAAARSGKAPRECYVVDIPKKTIRTLISSTNSGVAARHARPHRVRAHPRRLADGRIVRVRNHTRGGTPEEKAFYNARELSVVTQGSLIEAVISPVETRG